MFEQAIAEFLRVKPDVIVIAAAGNRYADKLDFPARFADVVAVGAVDSSNARPGYSNYGAKDSRGNDHELLFFAPGGGNGEYVASTMAWPEPPCHHDGTSFSAPYASGLMALYRAQVGGAPTRADILAYFRNNADPVLPANEYGNGLVRAETRTHVFGSAAAALLSVRFALRREVGGMHGESAVASWPP